MHKRTRIAAALVSALLVVFLFGNVVLANGMPTPSEYFKVIGNPDNDIWIMEILTDEPPKEVDELYDYPNDRYRDEVDTSEEERIEDLCGIYGEDVRDAHSVFAEYAASQGLNCTLIVDSNYTIRAGITEKAVISLGPPEFGFHGSFLYSDKSCYRFAFYFPKTGEMVITEPIGDKLSETRRFIIDLSERSEGSELSLHTPAQYLYRTMDLVTRMIFTMIVETLVAIVLFKVREKRFLLYIAIVNLFSNGIFNILTSCYNSVGWDSYIAGPVFLLKMFVGELIVFVVEAVIWTQYYKICDRPGFLKTWQSWLYSFVANSISAIGSVFIFFYFDSLIW